MAKERAEYCDAAEVGPLTRPSRPSSKAELSERTWAMSPPRLPGCSVKGGAIGLPFGAGPGCGVVWLPIGVASRSCGS